MSTPKKPEQVGPGKPLQQTLGGVMPPQSPSGAPPDATSWDDLTAQNDATELRQATAQTTPQGMPSIGGDRTLEAPVPAAVTRALAGLPPVQAKPPSASVGKVATPIDHSGAKKAEPRATAPTMAAASAPARPPSGTHREVSFTNAANPPPPVAAPATPGDPYLGSVVADRYRILRKLGEGGMGVVYLAEHVIIEKKVALKILSEDFARKADLVQRFMQEAKAASKIGHENIVDITDFGETPSGSVFFAMEYLEGIDLAGHIRRDGPMTFARTRHIITQICRALGAAHAKGIIHRDMKPENVFLIEREGLADFVKILDFGIAKMNTMEEGSRLTRTGMIFGTPEYMSPEQAKGDKPDHRVDIYAVGCILYEMLTGDVPFHADTFMGVLTKHMFEAPMPLGQRAPQSNVPPDVEAVVMKALAKDRDQRFQTMKEMSIALAACGGLPTDDAWGNEPSQVITRGDDSMAGRIPTFMQPSTGQTPLPPAAVAPPRKTSTALVVGVVGALALVGGGAVGFVMYNKQHVDPPPVAIKQLPPVQPVAPPVAPKQEPVAPARPSSYTMTFISKPDGAEVFRGSERLGATPLKVPFLAAAVAEKPVEVVCRKKGFKDYPIAVVADHDAVFDCLMEPASRQHGKSSTPTKLPRAPEHVTQPTAPPPLQKPPGKLRDLKDPFSQQGQ